MKKILSVIIVNFRSLRYLDKCLTSIYDSVPADKVEIVIVNNDKDESLVSVSEKFPEVILVDHKKNIGFGQGVNLGATMIEGEIIFLMNPDSEIIQGSPMDLAKEFQINAKLGVLGACLLNEKNRPQEWSAGEEINPSNLILNNLGIIKSKKIWLSESKISCDWVSGGAMFTRRSLFKKLNGFDKNFFMYFEDVDFCRRAKELGYDICYFPKLKIKHVGGGSYDKKTSQKEHFYKSQDYYFEKFYKKRAIILRIIKNIFLKK